jgi:hypothetical protein
VYQERQTRQIPNTSALYYLSLYIYYIIRRGWDIDWLKNCLMGQTCLLSFSRKFWTLPLKDCLIRKTCLSGTSQHPRMSTALVLRVSTLRRSGGAPSFAFYSVFYIRLCDARACTSSPLGCVKVDDSDKSFWESFSYPVDAYIRLRLLRTRRHENFLHVVYSSYDSSLWSRGKSSSDGKNYSFCRISWRVSLL